MSAGAPSDEQPPVPPPSPALAEAMRGLKPVATRRPLRSFAIAAARSLAWAAASLMVFPIRRDWPFLPRAWWFAAALVWLAGFVGTLGAALVPRRGSVVPDLARAGRFAAAAALGLIVFGLAATQNAPGHTLIPTGAASSARWAAHCLATSLVLAAPPFLLGAWLLRRVVLIGAWRAGAAVGAAAGALGGLTLHLVCPVGGGVHVGLGHGGGVLAFALIGAALGALLQRR